MTTPPVPIDSPVRPVAVIDVGATAIRMAIAEISADGQVRHLEALSRAVNLGKDAFTTGEIEQQTIEECVQVLKSYRRVLDEYQVAGSDDIRVVATSAVREASNRLAFIDRVFIATGVEIDPVDEAEVNRITYLGIQPMLRAESRLDGARAVVTEVGGGSTELLVVSDGDVEYSHSYRLGSLRLRETLEAYRAPRKKVRDIMQMQIRRTVEQIVQHMPAGRGAFEVVALGGDVRFAATRILAEWDRGRLARLPLDNLETLTNRMLDRTTDQLVQEFHMPFPDAETLGPALLAYVELARGFHLDRVLVSSVNFRDGLLQEMAGGNSWTEEFRRQIVRSAVALGWKYEFDEAHARHVAELAQTLFRALQDEHQLSARHELILYVAALLHQIGLYVGTGGHHKHAMYLINNSELFGLSEQNLMLVSLVARYHRRASPKPAHTGYAGLNREDRIAVSKMAAILRLAIALDESHSQRITDVDCRVERGRLIISTPGVEDLSLEQLALKQMGPLFEEVFGMQVLLRTVRD